MEILGCIFNALGSFFESVKRIFKKIISGVMSLANHVVSYFKGLYLKHRIPWIGRTDSLKDAIKNAKVVDLGITKSSSIVEGTYDEETDEIDNCRVLEADAMDDGIKKVLGHEKLVVLS